MTNLYGLLIYNSTKLDKYNYKSNDHINYKY